MDFYSGAHSERSTEKAFSHGTMPFEDVEEDEMDLDGRTDLTTDDYVQPIMDDELDSDSDSSAVRNVGNISDSDESVDAYEQLQDESNEDTPYRSARFRATENGNRNPGTAGTREQPLSSATVAAPSNMIASGSATTTNRPLGLPKHGRALSTSLDAADSFIFTMKSSGHGDKAVAVMLRKEGLGTYDAKTISTRYRRIREAEMAETDTALRTHRRHWTTDEDAALMDAYLHALRRQDKEMARLRKKLFTDVAFCLADTLPGAFFSAEACENRHGELSSGRAVTERDLKDPEVARVEGGRRLMAVCKAGMERVRREWMEWEDATVRELTEGERERRAEMRVERGGTIRQLRAERGPVKRGRPRGSKNWRGRGRAAGRGGKGKGGD